MADVEEKPHDIYLFQDLEAEEFAKLMGSFSIENHPVGSQILVEGYSVPKLYLLQEGQVKVVRNLADREIAIATFGPPHIFGELGVIDGGPASATVETVTKVVVLSCDRDTFLSLLDGSPMIGSIIWRNIAFELCRRLRRTTNQVQDIFSLNQALCDNPQFMEFYKKYGP
jgi:CRP/FNR family transcriptional regulator, cyclic AMP receptor protein